MRYTRDVTRAAFTLAAAMIVVACTSAPAERTSAPPPTSAVVSVPPPSAPPPEPRPAPSSNPSPALAIFPHDTTSFTEGLVYDCGVFYESTGMYGESKLLKYDVSTGRVIAQVRLSPTYFGEGLALLGGELYQLTWREHVCFVYDAETLTKKRELTYEGEGWGLTTDGTLLVMSDGSPVITFRDPKTLAVTRRITVTGGKGPIENVNELEWIDGKILANVWGTDVILKVDPTSGRTLEVKDFASLPEPLRRANEDNVLNGIAYDRDAGRLFLTGKRWSHIFQVPKL